MERGSSLGEEYEYLGQWERKEKKKKTALGARTSSRGK